MKLSEIIKEEDIILDFKANTKSDVLKILVGNVKNHFDADSLLSLLMEREKLGSTGVGEGVALPHVRMDSIESPIVVLGRSQKPLDFDAIDKKPCRLFFLVLGPTKQEAQEEYLQTMAKISRLMRDVEVRQKLLRAKTPAEIVARIKELEN